jgi:CubicO group peptidase (beta-lactamase class C family)
MLAMALALSAVALVRAADDLILTRFGEYLDAARAGGDPRLAAAIVGPTDVTWEGAFGQQDVDRNIATRLFSTFQLDDTTQTIVATLAVRCASDGWLSLDDRVSKYAPNSPDASATIGQLTHTTLARRPHLFLPSRPARAGGGRHCRPHRLVVRWGMAPSSKMLMADGARRLIQRRRPPRRSPRPPCSITADGAFPGHPATGQPRPPASS